MKAKIFTLFFLTFFNAFYSQESKQDLSLGFYYGFGKNILEEDYFYESNYYKVQLSYLIKESKHFEYELFVQPELNFVKHKLLNLDYIGVEEPNYIEKREEFGRLKHIKDYILNLGIIVRKPISDNCSVFVLASIGPMITDTETERLSKGFAFSSVLSLGVSLKVSPFVFELRPNFNHISNAGLQKNNNGFSIFNLEFGFKIPL
ncbi:acyloxyacyl hydrolase [Flavobacterium sp. W1B]|uniref:acyloxyacyl hydrolase n=1 Tax=Flavobacterium sp. W1B TaxID=3394146 RepID=UPI0039BC6525